MRGSATQLYRVFKKKGHGTEKPNAANTIGVRGGHTMVMMEYHHRTRDLGCSLCADCRGKNCGTPGICLQPSIFAQS